MCTLTETNSCMTCPLGNISDSDSSNQYSDSSYISSSASLHLPISLSLHRHLSISPSPQFSIYPSLHLSVSSSRGRSPGRSRCSNRPASSTPSPWRWPPWALGCLSTAPSGWPRESSWNRRRTDVSPQRRHAAECGELGGLPQNHDGLGCFH